MKRYLNVFAALAMSLMSSALIPSLKGGELDKKTTITISQPISVEGTVLAAGRYVLKLSGSPTGSAVVYIYNSEETRLITSVLAIHAYRLEPSDKSEFSFYESAPGQPTALRTWFYPGDETGFEFVRRPQHTVVAGPSAAGN